MWPMARICRTLALATALSLPFGGANPLLAQQTRDLPELYQPRPAPVFPALMVPYSIPGEFCRSGRRPGVTLRVFNSLTQPVATLVRRQRPTELIDGRPSDCGEFVARWNGQIGDPPRLAPNAVFYLQLAVDTSLATGRDGPPYLRTRKLVVPAY